MVLNSVDTVVPYVNATRSCSHTVFCHDCIATAAVIVKFNIKNVMTNATKFVIINI